MRQPVKGFQPQMLCVVRLVLWWRLLSRTLTFKVFALLSALLGHQGLQFTRLVPLGIFKNSVCSMRRQSRIRVKCEIGWLRCRSEDPPSPWLKTFKTVPIPQWGA